jgi:hypothetical protein
MSVAIIIVTASIVLAGIFIGVGRAFSYKRLENFGIEEFFQSAINAAIIGGLASIISLISGISATLATQTCGSGNAPEQLICTLSEIKESVFILLNESVKALDIMGYYQSLVLNFNAFSIAPFANLDSISNIFSSQVLLMQMQILLIELNIQILNFVEQNALVLLLPVGLVLRTLFVTRKAGGFLIALSIGLYVLYPSFIMIFPNPAPDLNNATQVLTNITNNSAYATVPIIDLNDNYAIAGKLDQLSGRCAGNLSNTSSCAQFATNSTNSSIDFTGDLTLATKSNSTSLAKVSLYSVIAPLLALIITIVLVRELGDLLGSEIGISTFSLI